MTAQWPEPPAERQQRKQRVQQQRKASRRTLPDIDTRTPKGKILPY